MTVSDFLSRHPGHHLASSNEIILIPFQIKDLVGNSYKSNSVIEALKDSGRLNAIINILC